MKGKTHDLNHDLTFSANTINCMCHCIRSMLRVLGVYNFVICNILLTLSFQLCTVFYSRVMKRQPFPTTVCGNLLDLSLPTFFRPKSAFFPNYGQYWLFLGVAWLVICTFIVSANFLMSLSLCTKVFSQRNFFTY